MEKGFTRIDHEKDLGLNQHHPAELIGIFDELKGLRLLKYDLAILNMMVVVQKKQFVCGLSK